VYPHGKVGSSPLDGGGAGEDALPDVAGEAAGSSAAGSSAAGSSAAGRPRPSRLGEPTGTAAVLQEVHETIENRDSYRGHNIYPGSEIIMKTLLVMKGL
jgi:hypothetical protein